LRGISAPFARIPVCMQSSHASRTQRHTYVERGVDVDVLNMPTA